MADTPVSPDAILGPGTGGPTLLGGASAESVGITTTGGVGDSPARAILGRDGDRGVLQPLAESVSPLAVPKLAGAVSGLLAKRQAITAQKDDRIRRKATDIVLSALRAPDLADLPPDAHANPPKGWTKKALRIAADATNSMKAAPAYLGMAQRIVESYKKAENDRPQAPQLNAEIVQVQVNNTYNYPVRVVEED